MNTRSFIIVRALLSYRYYIICHNNITSLSCRIQLKQRSESYLTVYPVKSTKTHVFITPNRYAVLNRDKDKVLTTPSTSTTEDPDRPSHKAYKVHNAKPVAPPINIKNISNFSAFNTVLNNITGPNGFICKSTLSYLILQPTDKRTYNAIIDHLHETSASFHLSPPQAIPHTKSSSKIYITPPYTPILLPLLLNWDIQSRVFIMPKTGSILLGYLSAI